VLRGRVCLRLRDAEDGHDPGGTGELDLGDQRFDERFALVAAASVDDLIDVVSDLAERSGRRRGGCEGELAGELVAAGAQLPGSGLELSKSPGEVFRVEGAVLERREREVPAEDLGGSSIICIDGLSKPVRSAASPRDYRRVRQYADEFRKRRTVYGQPER
jgi:hypothetical protein